MSEEQSFEFEASGDGWLPEDDKPEHWSYEDKLKPFLAFLREQGVENPALIRATHLRAFLVHLGESRGSWGCPRLLAGCTGLCALSGARGRIGTQPAG